MIIYYLPSGIMHSTLFISIPGTQLAHFWLLRKCSNETALSLTKGSKIFIYAITIIISSWFPAENRLKFFMNCQLSHYNLSRKKQIWFHKPISFFTVSFLANERQDLNMRIKAVIDLISLKFDLLRYTVVAKLFTVFIPYFLMV